MPCKITVARAELRDGWSAVGFSSPAAALTHSIMALRLRQTEITGLRQRHTGRRSVEHTCMTHEDADASACVRVRAHTHTPRKSVLSQRTRHVCVQLQQRGFCCFSDAIPVEFGLFD